MAQTGGALPQLQTGKKMGTKKSGGKKKGC